MDHMIKIKANGICDILHYVVCCHYQLLTKGSILEQSMANLLLAQALYLKGVSCQEQSRHQGRYGESSDFI